MIVRFSGWIVGRTDSEGKAVFWTGSAWTRNSYRAAKYPEREDANYVATQFGDRATVGEAAWLIPYPEGWDLET